MFAYCSTSAALRHWCYLACATPVHLAADTEQVTVKSIYLHILFANWTLTCLASAALGGLVLPCCCNFGASAATLNKSLFQFMSLFNSNLFASDFERVIFAVYLPMLFANCSLICLTSAALGALVLPLLCIYKILASDFEQVILAASTLNYLNSAAHRAFVVTFFS